MNQDFIIGQANRLLFEENLTAEDTIPRLVALGAEPEFATHVVGELIRQFRLNRKAQGQKDALYGLMWLLGGAVLTAADVGYIFWGASFLEGSSFYRVSSVCSDSISLC